MLSNIRAHRIAKHNFLLRLATVTSAEAESIVHRFERFDSSSFVHLLSGEIFEATTAIDAAKKAIASERGYLHLFP